MSELHLQRNADTSIVKEAFIDLTALPPAEHFVGRVGALSDLLDPLLSSSAHGFVMLHGLSGIGKTSLARVAAERVSRYYEDHVLAVSFETFATLDANNQRVANEAFVDRFYTSLAALYRLDAAKYNTVIELQQAILRERAHQRSLLILDNIETLFDALPHPAAQDCIDFLIRLKEGDGVILLISRLLAPVDWAIEANKIISLAGLSDESGADLFQAFLPVDCRPRAPRAACLALSQRVQGHPLSIRLLAGHFADEAALDLTTFLHSINEELAGAERTTPDSLHDPDRQKTLYACMDYSIRRLTPEQRTVLDTVSLFQAPFIETFATTALDDTEHTPLHLQHLVRLGLLNRISRTLGEDELILFAFHPMVRWYIELSRPRLEVDVKQRYGEIYAQLVQDATQPVSDYEQSMLTRALVQQSFVDCEAARAYLTPAASSALAYHLALLYYQLGQVRRAMDLHKQSLQTYQELGDVREVAVLQQALANVYVRQGKITEALSLYERSLQAYQNLGDVRGIALTQHALADVYVRQGKMEEALSLYEQSLQTGRELGDIGGIAATQINMGQILMQMGRQQQALSMTWNAYKHLTALHFSSDAEAAQGILLYFKTSVLKDEQFDQVWQQAIGEAQPAWLRDVQLEPEVPKNTVSLSAEAEEALSAYLTAANWDETRQVVETQQALLFQPVIEQFLEQLIGYAQSEENQRKARLFELQLTLLRQCQRAGIASAFAQLEKGAPNVEAAIAPFPPELIDQSVAALLGNPQEKEAYVQSLADQLAQTNDEQLKVLLGTIQRALFSTDLSTFGEDLDGVYKQAWNAIAATVVADGMDPRLFEAIVNNTVAVLGSAREHRGEWRDALADLRSQATLQENQSMVAFIDTIIALMDADGKPEGLGTNLQGIYAQTWQTIVSLLALANGAEPGPLDHPA